MIFFASLLAYISAFVGGYINLKGASLGREKLNISNGFSAGLLISIAIAHILPEADIQKNYPYVLLGLGIFYLIQGYVRTQHCGEVSCEVHGETGMLAWSAISFHALVDGVAMGISFQASEALGLLVMIAILVHKAPIGFSLTSILLSRGFNADRVRNLLMLFCAVTPVGALGSYFLLSGTTEATLSVALAFSGGTFLHIYASELLPEVHVERNKRIIVYVLLGIIVGIIPKFLGAPV